MSLTVAVTGPTGDIGRAYLRALDRRREVGRVVGMARRPFDPASLGLRKTEYRQGDVLDADAVRDLVAEADVVAHLAFIIFGNPDEAHRVNLQGSRTVFAAAAAAPAVKRLVYTSSVAAYGFHPDNPQPLTEDVDPRGTAMHHYSAHKAELESALDDALAGSATEAYVLRPCIVAGEDATAVIRELPYVQVAGRLPGAVRRALGAVPVLAPVVPDPGVPFQLVHHDDVAAALVAATLGRGEPGVYNLAGPGELTMKELAGALGWHTVPVPGVAVDAAAEIVARLPWLPAHAQWVNTVRVPVLMDTSRARRALGWRPRHDARDTLNRTVNAAHHQGLI
jgi:UDP-glucose 4-epimerase